MPIMTKMLEEAIKMVRTLPAAEQDAAAAMLMTVAPKNNELIELDDKMRAAIRVGRAQARPDLVLRENMVELRS